MPLQPSDYRNTGYRSNVAASFVTDCGLALGCLRLQLVANMPSRPLAIAVARYNASTGCSGGYHGMLGCLPRFKVGCW